MEGPRLVPESVRQAVAGPQSRGQVTAGAPLNPLPEPTDSTTCYAVPLRLMPGRPSKPPLVRLTLRLQYWAMLLQITFPVFAAFSVPLPFYPRRNIGPLIVSRSQAKPGVRLQYV